MNKKKQTILLFFLFSFSAYCALIIGKRKESTDKKTSLNDALRDYNVAV